MSLAAAVLRRESIPVALAATGEVPACLTAPVVVPPSKSDTLATDLTVDEFPSDISSVASGLARRMHERCIAPCLRAKTEAECNEQMMKVWEEYLQISSALHTVISQVLSGDNARSAAEQNLRGIVDFMCKRAADVAGEDAEGEFSFAAETYLRAMKLSWKVRARPLPAGKEKKDKRLVRRFTAMAALHVFGLYMVTGIARGETATPVAVRWAFEAMRVGALQAYVAVREALELRSVDDHAPEVGTEASADEALAAIDMADADLSIEAG